MSDRDYLDLDDDLPAADDAVGEWDADLLDDFPADDPAAADPALADAPAAGAAAGAATAAATAAAASGDPAGDEPTRAASGPGRGRGRRGRQRPRQHRGTGALVFLLVLLAGLLLGSGLLTATGAAPEALLDVSGFQDPLTIGDLRSHPVNAFWLAAAVVLAAAALAAVAVERRLRDLRETVVHQEAVLDAVRNLDVENPESWRDEQLQDDPDLAAVTSGLVGHLNLQQAKLSRYVGLEGELHRLEKAMAEESTADLAATWENPAAGSLADQASRLLAAREEADRQTRAAQEAAGDQGADLVSGLREAQLWSGQTREQMGQHGAVLERLARQLARLGEQLPQDGGDQARRERLQQALAAVQQELARVPVRTAEETPTASALGLLVERASRLAFQIAMEVARLGAKGERLLPLTQDLEELTTELRAAADTGAADGAADDPRDRALEAIRGRIAELDPAALGPAPDTEAAAAVGALTPDVQRTAGGLTQLAQGCADQARRLEALLRLAGEVTGVDPEATDPQADGGLPVERFDPFASSDQPQDDPLVADPFASSSAGSIFDAGEQSGDFAHTVLPGDEDRLLGGGTPEPATAGPTSAGPASAGPASTDPASADPASADPAPPEPAAPEPAATDPAPPDGGALGPGNLGPGTTDPGTGADAGTRADARADIAARQDPGPAGPDPDLAMPDPFAAPSTPRADAGPAAPGGGEALPSEPEKVYDLSEFDAVRLTSAPGAADEERIYDLAELGAERIT